MAMAARMITTTMAEGDIVRLMTWLSPSYPVGAYSYSHGLEHAVEVAAIRDRDSAGAWIADITAHGGGFADGVILAATHQAVEAGDDARLAEIAELAAAFSPTAEIALETRAQGAAFLKVTAETWGCAALDRLAAAWPGPHAYPVAVGAALAGHGIALRSGLIAYLHAFAANLVSAAVRLVPLGQTDGQRILAGLASVIADTSERARATPLDEIGTASVVADIASMRHETQYTRLFRS